MTERQSWDTGFAVTTGLFGFRAWLEVFDAELAAWMTALEFNYLLGGAA